MWVFDGEEWTQDEGNEHSKGSSKPESSRPRYDDLMPELQVVEIVVPVQPRKTNVPPLPLP